MTDNFERAPGEGLRSNFTPGSTRWAVRRAQWSAMGISVGDQQKAESRHRQHVFENCRCASLISMMWPCGWPWPVREAGGLPFEIRTRAPSDFVASAGRKARYPMPTRDLIINDVDAAVERAVLDGIVFLSSCDKTTPAHLMAAAQMDLPGDRRDRRVSGGRPVQQMLGRHRHGLRIGGSNRRRFPDRR